MQNVRVQVSEDVLLQINRDVSYHHGLKQYRPVAVAITENAAGNILLLKSSKGHYWGFPQGGIHRGEGIIEGLLRELREETSIRASAVRGYCYCDRLENSRAKRNGFSEGKYYYYFHVACEGTPRVVLQLDEVDAFQWLPPKRAVGVIQALKNGHEQKGRSMLTALSRAMGIRVPA